MWSAGCQEKPPEVLGSKTAEDCGNLLPEHFVLHRIDSEDLMLRCDDYQMLGVQMHQLNRRHLMLNLSVEDVFIIYDMLERKVVCVVPLHALDLGSAKKPKELIASRSRVLVGYDYYSNNLCLISPGCKTVFKTKLLCRPRREDMVLHLIDNTKLLLTAYSTKSSIVFVIINTETRKRIRTRIVKMNEAEGIEECLMKLMLVMATSNEAVFVVNIVYNYKFIGNYFLRYSWKTNSATILETKDFSMEQFDVVLPTINYGKWFFTYSVLANQQQSQRCFLRRIDLKKNEIVSVQQIDWRMFESLIRTSCFYSDPDDYVMVVTPTYQDCFKIWTIGKQSADNHDEMMDYKKEDQSLLLHLQNSIHLPRPTAHLAQSPSLLPPLQPQTEYSSSDVSSTADDDPTYLWTFSPNFGSLFSLSSEWRLSSLAILTPCLK